MSKHNKTYQPVKLLTIEASEDIPSARFVSYTGGLCGLETRAFGVSEIDFSEGDVASVITLGTAVVETSEAILQGADVTSDSDGKAKTAGALHPVNGRAIDGCSSASFIRIKFVP